MDDITVVEKEGSDGRDFVVTLSDESRDIIINMGKELTSEELSGGEYFNLAVNQILRDKMNSLEDKDSL